jgi:dienelactone hydrolase
MSKSFFATAISFAAVLTALLTLTGLSQAQGQRPSRPETVMIGAEDVQLMAVLYRPSGPGPHPAVIALHGCGGLFNTAGNPSARHADWGERLAARGFLVVMPDSFKSRGLGSQCGVLNRSVRPGRERVGDVLATKAWLQARSDVKAASISLLGWSNGGSTVLAAIRKDRKPADLAPDLARAWRSIQAAASRLNRRISTRGCRF